MGRAFEYRKAAKEKRWGNMSRVFPKLAKAIEKAAKEGGGEPDRTHRRHRDRAQTQTGGCRGAAPGHRGDAVHRGLPGAPEGHAGRRGGLSAGGRGRGSRGARFSSQRNWIEWGVIAD